MATPFFGKRETESTVVPAATNLRPGSSQGYATPGSAGPGQSTSTSGSSSTGGKAAEGATTTASSEGGSKLTVGPNIKLKGVEITDCDTLVVEGLVEATMDSRVIQIAEQGAFKGSAEIDVAEIRGEFSGNLTVRQKLVIYSTGKVTGNIRYGKLVIEEGGQLAGEIMFGTTPGNSVASMKPTATSKPLLQTV